MPMLIRAFGIELKNEHHFISTTGTWGDKEGASCWKSLVLNEPYESRALALRNGE